MLSLLWEIGKYLDELRLATRPMSADSEVLLQYPSKRSTCVRRADKMSKVECGVKMNR